MVSGRRRDATSPSLLSLKRTAGLALLAPSPCSLPLSTERTNELVVESAESGLDYGGSTGLNRPKEATPFFPQRRDRCRPLIARRRRRRTPPLTRSSSFFGVCFLSPHLHVSWLA